MTCEYVVSSSSLFRDGVERLSVSRAPSTTSHTSVELEGLLTLYNVELSTLNEDIAFIEAQSQGLQVQTANQKLLQTELQSLIETVDIAPQQLTALRDGQIGSKERWTREHRGRSGS